MRYITGGRATPRAEIETDILPWWIAQYERSPGAGVWAAVERANGAFTGWFHLRQYGDDRPRELELGYRLRAAAWGKGYATEGSRALVERAFRELGAERVVAETMAVNAASRRVMEKAGLLYVRTFRAEWPDRIDGDEHGDVEYALTRAEWSASQVT
jgi:RimJ/RimL family protein N-acetyltransferase